MIAVLTRFRDALFALGKLIRGDQNHVMGRDFRFRLIIGNFCCDGDFRAVGRGEIHGDHLFRRDFNVKPFQKDGQPLLTGDNGLHVFAVTNRHILSGGKGYVPACGGPGDIEGIVLRLRDRLVFHQDDGGTLGCGDGIESVSPSGGGDRQQKHGKGGGEGDNFVKPDMGGFVSVRGVIPAFRFHEIIPPVPF